MDDALRGRTIAISETRDLDVLARLLESHGATPLRCPLVNILDAPDPAPIEAWLAELVAGAFTDVIFFTGEGLRRLLGVADRAALRDAVIESLGRVRCITRGPKPARALMDIGLRPELAAQVPTTDGIIAGLSGAGDLAGRRFGVQLYGLDPNTKLVTFLRAGGATVKTVAPYVYAPASDDQRVMDLINRMAGGSVDVIAFTSGPQVQRFWDVAENGGLTGTLAQGLAKTQAAAVGPLVSEALARHGVRVMISPARSYSMKSLVNAIVEHLKDPA